MFELLLALSLNIDSFSIGVNYGIRKIKIPVLALLMIVIMSFAMLLMSYFLGHIIFMFIAPFLAKIISSALIVFWGLAMLFQTGYGAKEQDMREGKKPGTISIVAQIFKGSSSGDLDDSGVIDIKEALYIGAALSIDALTVGLSLSAYHINIVWFCVVCAALNFTFLLCGQLAGKKIGAFVSEKSLKIFAALIIIALGISKLF